MNCCFKKEPLLRLIQKIDLLFLAITFEVNINWNFPITFSPRTQTNPKRCCIKECQKKVVTVHFLYCGAKPPGPPGVSVSFVIVHLSCSYPGEMEKPGVHSPSQGVFVTPAGARNPVGIA